MKDDIKITYSTMGKVIILLILTILIVFGIIFILYPSVFAGSFIFRTEGSILLIGYFCLIVGINALVQHIYLFTFVRVGFQITNEGVINNTDFLTSELIKWKDIESISMPKKHKNSINIFIKNPKYYIKRTKNPLRKINIYGYFFCYKTPCVINVKILEIETTELMKLLQSKWKENRG